MGKNLRELYALQEEAKKLNLEDKYEDILYKNVNFAIQNNKRAKDSLINRGKNAEKPFIKYMRDGINFLNEAEAELKKLTADTTDEKQFQVQIMELITYLKKKYKEHIEKYDEYSKEQTTRFVVLRRLLREAYEEVSLIATLEKSKNLMMASRSITKFNEKVKAFLAVYNSKTRLGQSILESIDDD